VRCPALPKVPVGTYIPAECDDGTMRFHSNCELRCPDGYHIGFGPTSQNSDSRICNTNGTWDYRAISPTCKGIPFLGLKEFGQNIVVFQCGAGHVSADANKFICVM